MMSKPLLLQLLRRDPGGKAMLAVLLGLMGEHPESVDTDGIAGRVQQVREQRRLVLLGERPLAFDPDTDLAFHRKKTLPYHSNGMRFSAFDSDGGVLGAARHRRAGPPQRSRGDLVHRGHRSRDRRGG